MRIEKLLMIVLITTFNSGVTLAQEIKQEVERGFIAFSLGYENIEASNNNWNDSADVFAVGLNGGQLFKKSEKVAYKWFAGFDTGKDKYSGSLNGEGKVRLTNIIGGFQGVIYMGTPVASFNIGPVMAINRMTDKYKSDLYENFYSLWGASLGADLGFSFNITESFALDLGLRYLIPLTTFNNKCTIDSFDCSSDNSPDIIDSVSHIYIGFNTYLD